MITLIFSLSGCGKKTINLDKYMTITATGYDTMGSASYEFDYDSDGKIRILDLVHVPYMPTDDELLSNTFKKDEVLEITSRYPLWYD